MRLCLWVMCRHNRHSSETRWLRDLQPPIGQSCLILAEKSPFVFIWMGIWRIPLCIILPEWVQYCYWCNMSSASSSSYVLMAQKWPKSGQCLGAPAVVPGSSSSWKGCAVPQYSLGRWCARCRQRASELWCLTNWFSFKCLGQKDCWCHLKTPLLEFVDS